MLKKCLKYDLKAGARLWRYLSIGVIAAAIPIGAYFLYVDTETESPFPLLMFMALISTYVMANLALLIIPSVISLYHYYQTFNTDQAYLTFTLPVKREILYFSKLISTVVRFSLSLLSCLISFAILSLFIPAGKTNLFIHIFKLMGDGIQNSGIFFFLNLILVLLIVLLAAVLITVIIHALIRTGAATKSKVGVGIAIYLGIVFLSSVLSTPLMSLLISFVEVYSHGFADRVSALGSQFLTSGVLLLVVLIQATVIAMLVVGNIGKLEKKLNLL